MDTKIECTKHDLFTPFCKCDECEAETVEWRKNNLNGDFVCDECGTDDINLCKHVTPKTTPALFACSAAPLCWVASDETGALWLFDAIANGWATHLRPYIGERAALIQVPSYNALGTGWPHVKNQKRKL
jgi:hypothetical protein